MTDPLNPPPVEPTPEAPATPVAEPAAAPTYAAPAAPAYGVPATNGMATAALVLGIVALVLALLTFIPIAGPFFFGWAGFICAVLAIVLGIVGLNRAKKNGVGRSKALLGLIFGIASVVLGVIALIVSIAITASLGGAIVDYAQQVQAACAGEPSGTAVVLSDGTSVTCP